MLAKHRSTGLKMAKSPQYMQKSSGTARALFRTHQLCRNLQTWLLTAQEVLTQLAIACRPIQLAEEQSLTAVNMQDLG